MEKKTIRYNDAQWYGGIDLVVNYTLEDGVLTVLREGSYMHHNPAKDAEEIDWDFKCIPYMWSRYESPFVDLDFHTAVLEPGFTEIEEDFFSGCKNLKRVIIPDTVAQIDPGFARGVDLEYFEEDGLRYLGNEANPRLFLMGCTADFNEEHLRIPDTVRYIGQAAFQGKEFLKRVTLTPSLRRIGRNAFKGTSISHVYIPDEGVGEDAMADKWYFGFWRDCALESISVPYNHYLFYLENQDMEHVDWWHAFTMCSITFRNPDGTLAYILPPNPNPQFNEPEPLRIPDDIALDEDDTSNDDWIASILGSTDDTPSTSTSDKPTHGGDKPTAGDDCDELPF